MIVNDEHSHENEVSQRNSNFFIFIPAILVFLFAAYYLIFHYFSYGIPRAPLIECQSNLKNIGTALEMYSTDYAGQFPNSLSQLIPDYLDKIPKCAEANMDTYSGSYQVSHPYKLKFTMSGKKYYDYSYGADAYTMFCSGHYHSNRARPNYPHYNSRQGLVPK